MHVWETNAEKVFEHVRDITPDDSTFSFTFDPESLYSLTTTSQHKGSAKPLAQRPFPLLYRDDFESTELLKAPKYLSDQNGVFEAHPCTGRGGKCLQQVITQKPTPWRPLPDPFTLAGDASWTDYTVSADFRLLSEAPAVIMGCIDSADVFADGDARWPSGYVLPLKPDGLWELLSAQFKKPVVTLASGSTSIARGQWHRLELRFHGRQIQAILDGVSLTSSEDKTHLHGMFALGTEWDQIQFDNLTVTP